MTLLNQRELKRHEVAAFCLLGIAGLLWATGYWFRAGGRWVPEYPHAMLGIAAVALFTSLVWRILAFAQTLWRHTDPKYRPLGMLGYLAGYTLCIMLGAAWLIHEQRHLADIAWMREQSASLVVLYAILAIMLPWAAAFSMWILFKARHEAP